MEKKKKKISGAAAVTAAAAGAAVAAGTAFFSSESPQSAPATGEPVGEDEDILDGGMLSEVEVVGNAPVLDGGMLADVEVLGHASGEPVLAAEPEALSSQEEIAEAQSEASVSPAHVAEPVAAAEPLPVAEPVIAAPEPIAPEEEDFADFDDIDSSANGNLVSMKEGGVIDDVMDTLQKVGEDLGIINNTEEMMDDFINNADASEFTKL